MSAEVYLDTVDLEAPVFETVAIDSSRPETLESYPLPVIRATGRSEMVTFRVAVLENPWLKVVFNLDLGGRIGLVFDKRSGLHVLAPPASLEPDPHRRALAAGGLLAVGDRDPAYGLSTVDFVLREPQEIGAPAGLVLHDIVPIHNIGWHLEAELAEDRADLRMTVRIANRSLMPSPCPVAWRFFVPGAAATVLEDGVAVHRAADRAGFGLFFASDAFRVEASEGEVLLARPGREVLLPRETDAFSLRLVPWSGFERLMGASPVGAIGRQGGDLAIQVSEPVTEGRLVLDLESGSPVEAAVSLVPGALLQVDGGRIPGRVVAAAMVGSEGPLIETHREPILSEMPGRSPTRAALIDALDQPGTPEHGYAQAVHALALGRDAQREYGLASLVPGLESVSRIGLAREAVIRRDFTGAAEWVGLALEHNAEDPLAWWLVAAVGRHTGTSGDERTELLNAHYLAPLEPALRMESFLTTPSASREPSPLVQPLATNPDALIDGACLLIEFGLAEDAARWIDEALRHRELPALHYLLAWLLLQHTRMDAEAAQHLHAAAKLPIQPPLPWRWVEVAVLEALRSRFPGDEVLSRWCSLGNRKCLVEGVR
ncbi:MAG TPA: hypothetical protein PLH94_02190 [Fimbriimonadaceae bacterium]|nr:hypothetical protein [Fimbriimonadaceae bacterium]